MKDLINMINEENLKVVSINKEEQTFLCNNGIEYTLEDTDITIEELQKQLDNAKKIMKTILSEDGETTES